MKIALKSGINADPQYLYEIFRAAMEAHVNVARGEPWNEKREYTQFLDQLDLPSINLIVKNGKCVGYIDMRDENDARFIHMMVIVPKYQNKGIGSRVLKMLQEKTTDQKPIELTVLKGNQAAQKLYARHGFEITEEREHHYLMRWSSQ